MSQHSQTRSAFSRSEQLEAAVMPPVPPAFLRWRWLLAASALLLAIIALGCLDQKAPPAAKAPAGPPSPPAPPGPPPPPGMVPTVASAGSTDMSDGHLQQTSAAILSYWNATGQSAIATGTETAKGLDGYSWRVHILPHLGEQGLFDEIQKQEPWNSEANKAFAARMPAAYAAPQRAPNDGRTVVQGVTSDNAGKPRTFFGPAGKGSRMADVFDGTFNTVMLVQTDSEEAVDWMRPADWRFDPQNPRRGLGKLNRGGFFAVFTNGAVRFISNKISDDGLRKLFTVDGGEVLDDETTRAYEQVR